MALFSYHDPIVKIATVAIWEFSVRARHYFLQESDMVMPAGEKASANCWPIFRIVPAASSALHQPQRLWNEQGNLRDIGDQHQGDQQCDIERQQRLDQMLDFHS